MVQRVNMASPPAWLPDEERKHDRRRVDVAIVVDDPGGRSKPAILVDLSNAGCRLRLTERISLGAFVTVQLGPDCEAKGWVAWSRELDAGIDFSLCLPNEIVQEIAPTAD